MKKKLEGKKREGGPPSSKKRVTGGELIYLERIKKKGRERESCKTTMRLDASKICILHERVYITLINTSPIR